MMAMSPMLDPEGKGRPHTLLPLGVLGPPALGQMPACSQADQGPELLIGMTWTKNRLLRVPTCKE